MPEERFLIVQLHELLTYLGQHGVATLLVVAQHGLIGSQMQTPVDASYLADAVSCCATSRPRARCGRRSRW